jgi:hypothetical protein
MLKYLKDEKKLFGNLQSEEQKKLLIKMYEWVEETFDNGTFYTTDVFGYGSFERERRFISVYTEYRDYFLFQLHYINPEEVKKTGFDYSANSNGKYVDIRSHSIKTEHDIETLKNLIRLAYDSVPLKRINDDTLIIAKKLCDAYETTKLGGLEIPAWGRTLLVSTSDEIVTGNNPSVKYEGSMNVKNNIKCKLLKINADSGMALDAAILWGERNTGSPYHLFLSINGKSVLECYIPKWVTKKGQGHFTITIPNTFSSNEDNEAFKQLMLESQESSGEIAGMVLNDGKIIIADFPEVVDWKDAFYRHIRVLIIAAILRAEIKGICSLGLIPNGKQELVTKIIQVLRNIGNFDSEIIKDIQGAQDVIRNCQYFVSFDGKFASAKYAAWKDVSIERYKRFRQEDNAQFHASITQAALEKLGFKLDDGPELKKQFELWSTSNGLSAVSLTKVKIYSIHGIIPLKVRTLGTRELAENTPEKANFELWAPTRFAEFFPPPKESFKISIDNNLINTSRQHNTAGEVVIGTLSGHYSSIRTFVLEKGLKLGDTVYLHKLVNDKFELLLDAKGGEKDMSISNTGSKNIQDIISIGLETLNQYVSSRGFSFKKELLLNYIFSLKSKPFVILSGISGTGKTKIAQLFAEFMCPDQEIDEVTMDESDGTLIYKVPKYFLKYSRYVVRSNIAELIQTPISEKSSEINIKFDGIEGKCWFGYAGSQKNSKMVLFSGDVAKHVKSSIHIDDYLKIYLSVEDGKETLVFEKVNPEKKRVLKKSNRYCFLSVRPDWSDNRSILGFYNPITESYQPTELLKLMLRARKDLQNPYFVIFDEMNLSKVEYYFSDFLSCMESRRLTGNGEITSEKIILHDAETEVTYIDDDGQEYKIPKQIEIPINIYFTGTVNVDETTYMFSPKVLDRANVIEFNEVEMNNYKELILGKNREIVDLGVRGADNDFVYYFTDNGRYCSRLIEKNFSGGLEYYYDKLKELNNILEDFHMHFGYRVIDEIMMYLSYNFEYHEELTGSGFDLQLLQKVLPKLHGNRKQLEIPLTRLLKYCFNLKFNREGPLTIEEKTIAFNFDYDALILSQYEGKERLGFQEPQAEYLLDGIKPLFPRTAKKLCRMINMLDRQGYASFIE